MKRTASRLFQGAQALAAGRQAPAPSTMETQDVGTVIGVESKGSVETCTKTRARAQVKEMLIYSIFVMLFTFQTLFGANDQGTPVCSDCTKHVEVSHRGCRSAVPFYGQHSNSTHGVRVCTK